VNRTARAAWLVGLLGLTVPTLSEANCGAESCPLSPQALEASTRRWSVDFSYQYVDQDVTWDGTGEATGPEPAGHIEELFTRTKTWTLAGRAQVTPSLRFVATLPYLEREHAHEFEHHPGFFMVSQWNYEGLGDGMLLGQWTALGSPGAAVGAVMIQGGVKLPTGKTEVEEVNGEQPEPPARPGTGSTDWLAGLQLLRTWSVAAPGGRETALPLAIAVQGRWNGVGTEDYRVGNEVHASMSTSYLVWRSVSVLAQVNTVWHARDDVGNTDAEPHHTGGTSVFATPGLRVELPAGSSLYGYWQARVYEYTNGPQLVAPSHWIFGASFALGH
jgi:hypothetical protein